ncbi:MAG: AAA family ATPase, partial [Candidatus Paceibacterota bacterium]
ERQALKKEKDKLSLARLKKIEEELEDLNREITVKKQHWEKEKAIILKIKDVQSKTEELKNEAAAAEKVGDLDKVAEIKYGRLVALDNELKRHNEQLKETQKTVSMLRQEIGDDDIAEVVAEWTGIPLTRLKEAETAKLVKMEERLKTKVIGQDQAIESIAHCVRRSRSGLSDESHPMGSFIFMGPTGVGKTKLAKTLAWFLFDDEEAMVRIDMSEYMEKFSVSRLVGAPPGYVGYEEGGQLTEKVRRRPYSVVLFDEIEKAHPEVFNLMLQILDEGKITDSQGRVVNFRNTVIIMTSNIGAEIIQQHNLIGFNGKKQALNFEEMKSGLLAEVKKFFRPEFLNRIDEIIIFNPLRKEEMGKIVDIELEPVIRRLANQGIRLEVTPKAKEFLVHNGFDINFGARPLKRTIQKYIQNPLSLKILDGTLKDGEAVTADFDTAKSIIFRKG